jgi:cytohesin
MNILWRLILKLGVATKSVNDVFIHAVAEGDTAKVGAMLSCKKSLVDTETYWFGTSGVRPIHVATQEGKAEVVRLLLEHGGSANALDGENRSPLHIAAGRGDAALIAELLDQGGDIQGMSKDRRTPLHGAASGGHLAATKALLIRGADASARDDRGRTPLHVTSSLPVAEILLANGADPNAADGRRYTRLHLAAEREIEFVELLIGKNAVMDARTEEGETPLHWASKRGTIRVVELLLANGADVNAKDNHLQTPLHGAAEWGRPAVVRLLVDSGADVNARIATHMALGGGMTPLRLSKARQPRRFWCQDLRLTRAEKEAYAQVGDIFRSSGGVE